MSKTLEGLSGCLHLCFNAKLKNLDFVHSPLRVLREPGVSSQAQPRHDEAYLPGVLDHGRHDQRVVTRRSLAAGLGRRPEYLD